MTAYITLREELTHGLWFTVLIPWGDISCPEDRDDAVDCIAEEAADLLEATAEDDLATAAIGGGGGVKPEDCPHYVGENPRPYAENRAEYGIMTSSIKRTSALIGTASPALTTRSDVTGKER